VIFGTDYTVILHRSRWKLGGSGFGFVEISVKWGFIGVPSPLSAKGGIIFATVITTRKKVSP